jgi:hypothetical protein
MSSYFAFDMTRGPGFPWDSSQHYDNRDSAQRSREKMLRLGWQVGQVKEYRKPTECDSCGGLTHGQSHNSELCSLCGAILPA